MHFKIQGKGIIVLFLSVFANKFAMKVVPEQKLTYRRAGRRILAGRREV
jgi:hypothetical protein